MDSIVHRKSAISTRLLRYPDCSEWMVGDCAEARRRYAGNLLQAIIGNDYNAGTLEQTLRLLDHDNLCLTLSNSSDRLITGSEGTAALQRPFVESLLLKTSQRLIHGVMVTSHLERELQSRIILSSISLLHAHGVKEVEAGFFDTLRRQVQDRYRDLKWQRKPSKSLSEEGFRRFQCSYLLCSCAAYASKEFVRAEPLSAIVLTRVISAVTIAFDVASAATGGNLPSLKGTISQINSIIQPLQTSVSERYATLFTFQELVRLTVALHTFLVVTRREEEEREQHLVDILSWSEQIALASLDKVISIIDDDLSSRLEIQGPPTPVHEFFLAFTGRGPPPLKLYFFLYGLLDCAALLCRVIPNGALENSFKNQMKRILRQGVEPSFRWKAIEILLADPSTRSLESQNLINLASQPGFESTDLSEEVRVIARCLDHEESGLPDVSLDRTVSDTLSCDGAQDAIRSDDWQEESLTPIPLSETAESFKIKISGGRYDLAGLAPDGAYAFFLNSSSILLCQLSIYTSTGTGSLVLRKERVGKSSFEKAALSEHYLAVLTMDNLAVYAYKSALAGKDDQLRKVSFGSTSGQGGWGPSCVAVHENGMDVYVAVGGGKGQQNSVRAGFCLYQVVHNGQAMTLSEPKYCYSPETSHVGFVKAISFSPDGNRVACTTDCNVLVWTREQMTEEYSPPFSVFRKFTEEFDYGGLTSATIFSPKSSRQYMLCTTDSSSERHKNGGEWSFLSPVGVGSTIMPPGLETNLFQYRNTQGILAGAVSFDGSVVALLEGSGKIIMLPVNANTHGGLGTYGSPTILECTLSNHARRKKVSPTCLRFCKSERGQYLVAVDVKGNVVSKRIGILPTTQFELESSEPLSPRGSGTSFEPGSSATSSSADSHVKSRRISFPRASAFARMRKKSGVS